MNTIAFLLCLLVAVVFYMIFIWIIVRKIELRFNEKLNSIRIDIHTNRMNIELDVKLLRKYYEDFKKQNEYDLKIINSHLNVIDSTFYKINNPAKYKNGKLTDNIIIISSYFVRYDSEFARIISRIDGYWEYEVFIVDLNKKMTKTNEGIEELLKEESEKK